MSFFTTTKMKEILNQVPDRETKKAVVQRMIQRGNEIEGLNARFEPKKAIANVLPSAFEFGKNIVKAVGGAFPQISEEERPGIEEALQTNPFLGAIEVIKEAPTFAAIGNLFKGAVQKLIPGEQEAEKNVDAMVDFFKEKYGSIDRLLNTIEENPVEVLADAASVVGGGAIALKGAAKVAGIAGKVSAAAKLTTAAKATAKVGAGLEPVSFGGQIIKKAGQVAAKTGINKIVNSAIKNVSTKIADKLTASSLKLKPTAIEKIQKKTFGNVSPEKWLNQRKISGSLESIVDELSEIHTKSKQLADSKLAAIPDKIRTGKALPIIQNLRNKFDDVISSEGNVIKRRLDELLEKGLTKEEVFFIDKTIARKIDKVKVEGLKTAQDITRERFNISKKIPLKDAKTIIAERLNLPEKVIKVKKVKRIPSEGFTLTELNEVKRLLDDFDSPFKVGGDLKDSINAFDVGAQRRSLRALIEREAAKRGAKTIRQINNDTQISRGIRDALKSSLKTRSTNRVLGLTDLIIGSVAGVGISPAVGFGIVIAKKILESPAIKTSAAKAIMALSDVDFKIIEAFQKTGKATSATKRVIREVMATAKEGIKSVTARQAAFQTGRLRKETE